MLVATIGIERETYVIVEGSGSVEVVVLLLSGTLDDTSIEYTISTSSETATGILCFFFFQDWCKNINCVH